MGVFMKKFLDFLRNMYKTEVSAFKWCVFTVTVTAAVIAGTALLVYIVDPLYRYREPFFYDMVYYELYATAPHILRNQDYDLLMLGTSMTRNFFLSDIDVAYGCRSIKLAASGGTIEDICKMFDVARKSKGDKLKKVVLSLDIYPLNKQGGHYRDFDYMYREDHREDYRYLFSRQTFSSMFYLILSNARCVRNVSGSTRLTATGCFLLNMQVNLTDLKRFSKMPSTMRGYITPSSLMIRNGTVKTFTDFCCRYLTVIRISALPFICRRTISTPTARVRSSAKQRDLSGSVQKFCWNC